MKTSTVIKIFWYLLEALFALWLDNKGTSNPYKHKTKNIVWGHWACNKALMNKKSQNIQLDANSNLQSGVKTYNYKQIGLQKILLTFLPNIKPCYLAPARPLGLPWFRLNYFGVCPSLLCSALAGELANIQRRVSDFLPSNGFLPMSQNGLKTILKSNFKLYNLNLFKTPLESVWFLYRLVNILWHNFIQFDPF